MTQLDFKISDNVKYKIEVIWDKVVYTKELKVEHLLRLYYLILQKNYSKKNTWESALAI